MVLCADAAERHAMTEAVEAGPQSHLIFIGGPETEAIFKWVVWRAVASILFP